MAYTAPLSKHGEEHAREGIGRLVHFGRPHCDACRHLDIDDRADHPAAGYWPDRVVHLVDPDGDDLRTRHPATLCQHHYYALPVTFGASYAVFGTVVSHEDNRNKYRTDVERVERLD